RFGTFVDGQRINAAVEVRVGSHVQLGGGGPILRVVSIEQTATAKDSRPPSELGRMETVSEPKVKANELPPDLRTQKYPKVSPTPPQAALELLNSKGNSIKRIELSRDLTRLGRDPESELAIDADAAVVSRRHAEIKKSDDRFFIHDLKSFNGTLVNGQRITEPR